MIVTINPITIGDVTTDQAIVNVSLGDGSVAMSLFPAVEVGGSWVRLEGADAIPVVGSYPELFEALGPALQAFVTGIGA